ncbi:MAG: OmpA family protein [bacterium]|nr:OmpA family protein [bacterium]
MKFNTNMNLKAIVSFSFMTASLFSFGQGENLVPNPSFESKEKTPKRLGSIAYATDWSSPTGVRADFFTPNKVQDINAPDNIYGSEDAKDGSNYIGITAYSYGNKVPRSYAMTKLEAPMKKGLKYCVKFNVSLSEASKYASNNLAARFTNKAYSTEAKVPMITQDRNELLMHFDNNLTIQSARYNWSEICGVYTSTGGEKYITIGNFLSDEDTKSERMKKADDSKAKIIVAAYYYIDDISVTLLDEENGERCDCAVEEAGDTYSAMIYQRQFNITEDMSDEEQIEEHEIFFAFGRNTLSSEGKESLNFIAEKLKANPEMRLEIQGHNNAQEDVVGEEKTKYASMDSKRVASVMQYLADQGVPTSSMLSAQRGSTEPHETVEGVTDEEMIQAMSRRVTFKVR